MEFIKKKKSDVVKKTRKQELLELLKGLDMDEVAVISGVDEKRAHSDRSILSRISKEFKIGFGSSYEDGKFSVWREKFVSVEKRRETAKTRAMAETPKVLDPRIVNLEVGEKLVVENSTTVSAELAKLRRQARHMGIKVKSVQNGKNVELIRIS